MKDGPSGLVFSTQPKARNDQRGNVIMSRMAHLALVVVLRLAPVNRRTPAPTSCCQCRLNNDGELVEDARGHGDNTRPNLEGIVYQLYTTQLAGGQASSFHLYVRVSVTSGG